VAAAKKMIDILQEVVAVPLIGLSTDKIQFLQTPTVQAELEKLLDKEGVVGAWKVQKDNTLVVFSTEMYCATNFLVRIFVKNLDMFLNGFGLCFRYCE
jgi:hypothetical protein